MIDHQKDEHDIEYSSEFLSQPENESSTSNSVCEINYFANDQSSNSDSENKNYFAEYVEKTRLNVLKKQIRFKL